MAYCREGKTIQLGTVIDNIKNNATLLEKRNEEDKKQLSASNEALEARIRRLECRLRNLESPQQVLDCSN
jgi:hypothetical protein